MQKHHLCTQQTIEVLLDYLRQHFYSMPSKSFFFRDKRALTLAITWPAKWMQKHNLQCSEKQYTDIIIEILKNITKHGDLTRARQYFPAYLFKCIQDHFHHNFDHLYDQLKHISCAIDRIHIPQATSKKDQNYRNLQNMAAIHDILANQSRCKKTKTSSKQMTMTLF